METINSTILKLSQLLENSGQLAGLPSNPRKVDKTRLKKLVKSISDHPEMMALRELLVYPFEGKYLVIGGNMRLKALKKLR